MTTSGQESTIYSFGAVSDDGAAPLGGFVLLNQALYGTTLGGGTFNDGTVFKIPL